MNEVLQPVNKHGIQAFIYRCLGDTPFKNLHNKKGFKFFVFSDLFPLKEFQRGGKINLIIASPISSLLKVIKERIIFNDVYSWGGWKVKIIETKLFDIPLRRNWITSSPVIIRFEEEGNKETYFSVDRGHSLLVFLERVKDNALKKYEAYYGESIDIEGMIFDKMVYSKTVAVEVDIKGQRLPVIGSKWKLLSTIRPKNQLEKKFLKFLFDTGLGEMNSLGFGFINTPDPPRRTFRNRMK